MIKINQLKVRPGFSNQEILSKITKLLKCKPNEIESFQIIKSSIDARKKPEILYSLTVSVNVKKEEEILKKTARLSDVCKYQPIEYHFPPSGEGKLTHRPVIIGCGPAGLFCAYFLSKYGYQPILFERGKEVAKRQADIEKFWKTGILDTGSNVQFGEGGAGTFSDGKLNTLVNDKDGRNLEVLKIFVDNGAPKEILYDAKPHIGTDILMKVVASMREKIIESGGDVFFESQLTDIIIENRQVKAVIINETKRIETGNLVLAIGHSARDTFEMLHKKKIPMEAKSFAVGFRVIHPQSMINESQYGEKHPEKLPPSAYKVTGKGSNERGVYSFCMCPGGYVVNASSEENRLAVNGMSYSDRGGEYANSAIIVAVTPKDFGDSDALAGIQFQRRLEEAAYMAGEGKIPVEYYEDFKNTIQESGKPKQTGKPKQQLREVVFEHDIPIKGLYKTADMTQILPKDVNEALIDGMESFERKIKGFTSGEAVFAGVESRTSSPVRIHRDETLQSQISGLYPCGEGAGYAGGITSAAMDGIRIAEAIRKSFQPL